MPLEMSDSALFVVTPFGGLGRLMPAQEPQTGQRQTASVPFKVMITGSDEVTLTVCGETDRVVLAPVTRGSTNGRP
jgi:hypothetical protein